MKKLLLVAAAALCATGCGRQWWNTYGCGQTVNYGMADCCAPSCCDGGMGGDMVSPGFTTGYPAMQVMPGPEIVPAPGR